ncbi:nucleotidyltransferase family protein [Paenibacillus sacheonensis]|uniref:NTP transferase domain-containing protein n=1 Tax=Paenibacillus sacheonensis TaxID=742054 RepID=A0A7X4YM42_9BACL|nr:nucleotidyltransferase family protein [Paenibacillus sacheonensis]MBM7563306.1 molybdenum cofactor cytidylyltransferase [Paenibacillus sacheonensis]NBC68136.1 NTP transferase domain-containing protein [Paenibacillus sacheonensis]
MRIGAIYLAAGFSRRMGEAKLPLELAPGITVGSRGLLALRGCGFQPIVVVVRLGDPLLWLYDKAGNFGSLPKFRIIPCKDAREGMSRSIRSGMEALLPEELDAVLITLADQPFISVMQLQRLIAVYKEDPMVDFVASGNGKISAPPVIFSKSLFSRLCQLEGDAGARGILQSPDYRGKVVRYASEWSFVDVDTKEQLDKARLIWSQVQARAK